MSQKVASLRQLLKKIAKEQKYEKPKIHIEETSSGGAHYTSNLFKVMIKEENKDDLHLFAKVAALGEEFRKGMPWDMYGTEQYVYRKLLVKYASLEYENGVPEEHRLFFTKCYGFDSSKNQEILVLENLLLKGYRPYDRFQSYGWEYASGAVTNLAKMHALSFAFSKQYPDEYVKTLVALKMVYKESEQVDTSLKKMVNIALKNVKPEHREALEKFIADKTHPFIMYGAIRKTAIVHGDFRGSNLLHRVRDDGKVEIKILDLQTMQAGSPAADLVFFIFSCSDEDFRAKYYERLVEHYYLQLCAAMKRLNLDPEEAYSRDDFEHEMQEKLPHGLEIAVFLLPVFTVEKENAPVVNENTEMANLVVEKTSPLYTERLNGIVNDYIKWGILK